MKDIAIKCAMIYLGLCILSTVWILIVAFKPAYSLKVNGAIIRQFQFENGYGASVHKAPGEYLWQLGVTKQPDDNLVESSPIFTGSLKTGLVWTDVEKLLTQISELEPVNDNN